MNQNLSQMLLRVCACAGAILSIWACSKDGSEEPGNAKISVTTAAVTEISGTSAVMTKPFSTAVLLATVQSLLRNRAKLRWYYEQEIPGKHMAFEDRTLELSPLDQTFIDRVHAFIERHLDDSEYGVDEIVREIGMSRPQFYRKIKALTDYSPNEYIRIIRLGRATELLAEGHLTIAEVSYRVGFSSPSYFTKCFKAQYGALPTEWMERYRKE